MTVNILRRLRGKRSDAHASRSLMARAAHGFAWVFAWRMATRFMGLGSTLVLVRLLAPAEFGIVAIALSFIGSIDQFSQIGVEEALVRMPAPDRRTYDTAFTMIVLRCILIAVITVIAAWPVAIFFKEPRLVAIMLAIAGVTVIAGFENVGVQDFRREMRFDREFMLQAVPRLAGIVATIVVALVWRNFWALIIGTATTRIFRVAMSYAIHPLRPRFSLSAWRDLISFSLWTWAICVARVLRDQPSTFIIGSALGPAGLGMLGVGSEIALLPMTEIVQPMGRSMFSAFALARRSGEDIETIFCRLIGMTALLTVPASVGLALVATPLVHLMLGPAWSAAAPLLQVVAAGGALAVIGHACHAQFDAFGLLRQDFSVILFGAVIRTALVAGLVPWFGLMGAAVGFALSLTLESISYLVAKFWFMPFRVRALAGVVVRPALATVCMALAASCTYMGLGTPTPDLSVLILRLTLTVLVGTLSYSGSILAFWLFMGRPPGVEADLISAIVQRTRSADLEPARS